jgi:hypothetical protein
MMTWLLTTRLHYYEEIAVKAPKQTIFEFLIDKRKHKEAHPLIISAEMLPDSGDIDSDKQRWEITDNLSTGKLVYRTSVEIDRNALKVTNTVEPMVLGLLRMTVTQQVVETDDPEVFLIKDTTEGIVPWILEYYTRTTGQSAHKVMLKNMKDYLERPNNV